MAHLYTLFINPLTFFLSRIDPLPLTIILQPVSCSSCLAVIPLGPRIRPTKLNWNEKKKRTKSLKMTNQCKCRKHSWDREMMMMMLKTSPIINCLNQQWNTQWWLPQRMTHMDFHLNMNWILLYGVIVSVVVAVVIIITVSFFFFFFSCGPYLVIVVVECDLFWNVIRSTRHIFNCRME